MMYILVVTLHAIEAQNRSHSASN